jgi:FkbM family methyltransferase
MSELTTLFDDVSQRSKPLAEREPITKLLDQLLEDIIAHLRPDLLLEVGAFEASFSKKMKKAYPEAEVIALEANPRVFDHFSTNLEMTGVKYKHIAAGANTGSVTIHIPTIIAGKDMPKVGRMGSLLEVGLRDSVTEKVEVACDTIDNILSEESFKRACLWIDVEGFVDQVLQGAQGTLEKTQILYAELESSPVWAGQTLAPEIVEKLGSRGFFPIARDCQKWFQFNVIFVRKEIIDTDWLRSATDAFKANAIDAYLSPKGQS